MTNDQGLFTKIKESSLSISLTAALILVASIVVIISSITIQSAYMWLAVGATAVLFLGFCSCTTCEKSSHFHFRRGSIHSDSVSTISDGRDNFYEFRPQVGHLQNTPPYWIADLPPSYAVATAASMAPDAQLPPPYSSVADVHAPLRVYSDHVKPHEQNYFTPAPPPSPPPPPPPPPTTADSAEPPPSPPPPAATADSSTSPINVPSGICYVATAANNINNNVVNNINSGRICRTVDRGTDVRHAVNCRCESCVLGGSLC